MDVTSGNRYGHSPCFYADFSSHRQCVAYLMIVETSLSLAKKLVRLERSMEQLSLSLAKHETGDNSTAQEYSAGADKSSATSSVEDDGTKAEAWQILTSVYFRY